MQEKKLPYYFDDTRGRIVITDHRLPQPWINYLSNGRMHAFVSQAGGGMCWWRTTQNCRLTRYRFYHLPIDSPGFYVYIRMTDGTIWSPTFRPCDTPPDRWEAAHHAGYSVFTAEKDGLLVILTLFVSMDRDALIWNVQIENLHGEPQTCDVFAYTEFSQLAFGSEVSLGYYLKWNTAAHYDRETNAIHYLYTSWMQINTAKAPLVYFSSSEPADSWCCNRDLFCGNYRDERNPLQVEQGQLGNQDMAGGEPCGALHHHVVLDGHEKKQLTFYLGVTPGALSDYAAAVKSTAESLCFLKTEGETGRQFDKVIAWWDTHLGIYQCMLPDEDAQRQINLWNPVQSVVTARFSRSISSSASGIRGVGFRDTAQDMLAQAYRKPDWARETLLLLASQQFEDGHTVHTFWPDDGKPPQNITRSDDHIWMTYLAYAIIAETGDLSLLDETVPFWDQDMKTAVNPAPLWEHLLRGIEFTENHLGEHKLPLILFSDWNDHLGPFGRKGKGETMMVSQQHICALRQLSELAAARGDNANVERFAQLIAKQETALAQYAWDGEWYLRGLDDEGQPIGSASNDYAKIWINTQSWMVICGSGKKEQNLRAMDAVRERMDTGMGLLINTPGIPVSPDQTNHKANGLPAGYSENGGIFCQTNCWAIIAEALLGHGNRAWQYYKQVMPHEVIQRIGLEAYRGEAYAYSSTMLGPDNDQFGQACVSQVTGTAAWMDVAATQYLLGIRPTLHGLLIDPCIPESWEGFTVRRRYRGCMLTIRVENPAHVQHGVKTMLLDGRALSMPAVPLLLPILIAGREVAEVTILLG